VTCGPDPHVRTHITEPVNLPAEVRLNRDDAEEIAEAIGALGSWLYQAPEAIRRDFARHAFPDPATPGANTGEFLDALHHAWRHLCDTLSESTHNRGSQPTT
jgi:hypothetical protein